MFTFIEDLTSDKGGSFRMTQLLTSRKCNHWFKGPSIFIAAVSSLGDK